MHERRYLGIVAACVVCFSLLGCGGVNETAPVAPTETSKEALEARDKAMKESMEKSKQMMQQNRPGGRR